jgi:hypothetical protein
VNNMLARVEAAAMHACRETMDEFVRALDGRSVWGPPICF